MSKELIEEILISDKDPDYFIKWAINLSTQNQYSSSPFT